MQKSSFQMQGCGGLRVAAAAFSVFVLGAISNAATAARVGSREMSASDLNLRRQVEQAYHADERVSTGTVAVILIQDLIAAEVSRRLGVEATTTECEDLAAYAESTSQAPELLGKVKAVFRGDQEAYLRLYISPKVVEQKLRGYFVHSRELHREQIRAIEAAMADARATSDSETAAFADTVPIPRLQLLAARHKLEYTTSTLRETETPGTQALPVRLEFRKDPLVELVRVLAPGEIYGNIIENDEEFRITRLLGHEGSTTHTVESLVARKRSYDEWFREQSAKVPIVFFNAPLAAEIKAQYPSLGWWSQVTVKDKQEETTP